MTVEIHEQCRINHGGRDTRAVSDKSMSREIQMKFSRDRLKAKHAFIRKKLRKVSLLLLFYFFFHTISLKRYRCSLISEFQKELKRD